MEHKQFIREVEGSKTAVVFIHGILGTPNFFQGFIDATPKNYSIYNVLLDGHGKKMKDMAETSMDKWKAQIHNLIEEIDKKYENIFMVSHSMGTLFSVRAGIDFPYKIKGLFLISIPLRIVVKPEAFTTSMKVALDDVDPNNIKAVAMRDGCSIELEKKVWKYFSWAPRYIELFQEVERVKKILPLLDVPSYVFLGIDDELVSMRSDKYFDTTVDVNLFTLEESGHFYYTPKDMDKMILEYKEMIRRYEV